jgi:hypothetical protein
MTFCIRCEYTAQIVFRLNAFLLNVIKTFVVGLPDFQFGTGDKFSLGIRHLALHQNRFTLAIKADVCAVWIMRCVGNVEGTEHRRFRLA